MLFRSGRYPAFEPVSAKKKTKAKSRTGPKDKEHRRKRSSLASNPAPDIHWSEDGPSPSIAEKASPPKATLWTWCPLCGHGGHTNCLSTWFSDASSDGACATEGCLCDCVSGRRRDEKIDELLRKKAEKEAAKTVRKGDEWKVHERKAVSAVRGAFGESTIQPRDGHAGQQGPGAPSGVLPGRRDDSKRVRVVVPHDEQQAPASHFQAPSHGATFGKMPKY